MKMAIAVRNQEQDRWQRLKALALDGVSSPHSKRAYETALDDFLGWYNQDGHLGFTKSTICAFRSKLEAAGLSPATINVRLSAIRKLATEAADNGLLAPELAAGILKVKGAKRHGVRMGNWLSKEQAQALLLAPDVSMLKGKRDRAILAVLLGCALRRSEIAALTVEHIQQRDGRWVIVDMVGKHGRVRSVPVPLWVKVAIDQWVGAGAITAGPLFRAVNKGDRVWGEALSEKVIWQMLQRYAEQCDIPHLAPHDLRRTCAKLCRAAGGDLEQIQFLLGHASVQTTERYLGSKQDLINAPNDRIGLNLASS